MEEEKKEPYEGMLKAKTKKELEAQVTTLEEFTRKQISALVEATSELGKRIKALEEKLKEKDLSMLPSEPPKMQERVASQEIQMPADWQAVINELLDARFVVKLKTLDDKPGFMLTVKVPPELSSKQALIENKEDWRIKVLRPNDGVNGIREYITLVRENIRKEYPAKL